MPVMVEFVKYEIYSSWWASFIWWDWGQKLVGEYFAWKTSIKYGRYSKWLRFKRKLKELDTHRE